MINKKENELNTYLTTHQPEACRKCGRQTEILEKQGVLETHQCPKCSYKYLVKWVPKDETDPDLELVDKGDTPDLPNPPIEIPVRPAGMPSGLAGPLFDAMSKEEQDGPEPPDDE